MILILSVKDDFHAVAIQHAIKDLGYEDCHLLECDRLSTDHRINWLYDGDNICGKIIFHNGEEIDISDISLIWWRRFNADQILDAEYSDDHQIKLINNDVRGSLIGSLQANFRGKWISNPLATQRAANKIVQLSIALECGFRIPQTLISQSQEVVQDFLNSFEGRAIVKPVVGAAGPLTFTEYMDDPSQFDPASFRICPALYQEYIEGVDHIRLNCFGDQSYAGIIECHELDWRPNLNIPIEPWEVPQDLHRKIRTVLDRLDLEMGIFDLKITPQGEYVWFEVNPQGQFLFLEPLTKTPYTKIFAEYLIENSMVRAE